MHMADALLSPAVGGIMWSAAIAAEAYSIRKLQKQDIFEDRKIPVMGVAGAFIFAAQMINIAIPGTGSSGHLGGGLLLSAILGPYAGFLVLSVVLAIQALFFADGGLLALGANIINMGFFTCFVAYPLIMKPFLMKKRDGKGFFAASILAAAIGMILGALGVVVETTASGITELPFAAFLSLMLPVHLAIGAVEGVVTALVLVFINQSEPSLLDGEKINGTGFRKTLSILLVVAVLLAVVASRFASQKPDGLEWSILHTAGTQELETDSALHSALSAAQEKASFLPDYDLKNAGESGSDIGGSVAGAVGTALVLGMIAISGLIMRCFRKRSRS